MLSRTLLLLCSVLAVANATIVSSTKKIKEGKYTSYYDDSLWTHCETVLLIGVGTLMATTDYSILSDTISKGKPIVTIITDHDPNFPFKLNDKKFAKLYNKLARDIDKLIPVCKNKRPQIIIGAHSASGQASIEAMQKGLEPRPDGFIGLDPFKITERKMKIDSNLPVLSFGFEKTTCKVKVNQAAKPAYKIASKDKRVFYKIDNKKQTIKHCAFTDKGCMGPICGHKPEADWVRSLVARSIHAFVKVVKSGGSFYKSSFSLPAGGDGSYTLYVGTDEP